MPANQRPGVTVQHLQGATLLSFERRGIFSNWILECDIRSANKESIHEQAQEFFHLQRQTGFTWLVFDNQLQPDTEDWFIRQGYCKSETVDILVRKVNQNITYSGKIHIKQVETLQEMEYALRLDDSFSEHSEEQLQSAIEKNYQQMLNGSPYKRILAFQDSIPVAVTCLRIDEDVRIGYLAGATTLAAYRNKGFYTAMVTYREWLAARNNAVWLATHAHTTTSSPILQKRGFERLSSIHCFALEL